MIEEAGAAAQEASRLQQAASTAAFAMRHKEKIVAVMEILRERQAVSDEDEVKVVAAYEQGTPVARAAINELLEKLQKAKLGNILIGLQPESSTTQLTMEGVQKMAQPFLSMGKEQIRAEALPYLEKARQKLVELKALEGPTLQRLEVVGSDLASAGRELAKGLKGMGKEAADELVKQGKTYWMNAETEELEREIFDWTLKTLPKAETMLRRIFLGFGFLLVIGGVLVAVRQFTLLKELAVYAAILILIFMGLMMVKLAIDFSETLRQSRGEMDTLLKMTPRERRAHLTRRWAQRAQAEGMLSAQEAQSVIQDALKGLPTPPPAPPPVPPAAPEAPPSSNSP